MVSMPTIKGFYIMVIYDEEIEFYYMHDDVSKDIDDEDRFKLVKTYNYDEDEVTSMAQDKDRLVYVADDYHNCYVLGDVKDV